MNKKICKQFPILKEKMNGKSLIYFDNAATSQKPKEMINAIVNYYETANANVHRSINDLADRATYLYEGSRQKVSTFIGATKQEIVFTKNTTEALNLVAKSYGRSVLEKGDVVLLGIDNHHSNLVPWQQLAREIGFDIKYIPLTQQQRLDVQKAQEIFKEYRVKLVALSHISSVLGFINPIEELISLAKKNNATTVIDMAQSMAHVAIDVKKLDVDFISFSGHKMYGPTGIGVLYGKKKLLEQMPAWIGGGGMISDVKERSFASTDSPYRFEAGTPPIAQAIGLAAAITFLQKVGLEKVYLHEAELTKYALEKLQSLPFVKIIGPTGMDNRIGVISFVVDKMHAHDVAEGLGKFGVSARAGHHCTQVLHDYIKIPATTRISFALYNTQKEIDVLVEALWKVYKAFNS